MIHPAEFSFSISKAYIILASSLGPSPQAGGAGDKANIILASSLGPSPQAGGAGDKANIICGTCLVSSVLRNVLYRW